MPLEPEMYLERNLQSVNLLYLSQYWLVSLCSPHLSHGQTKWRALIQHYYGGILWIGGGGDRILLESNLLSVVRTFWPINIPNLYMQTKDDVWFPAPLVANKAAFMDPSQAKARVDWDNFSLSYAGILLDRWLFVWKDRSGHLIVVYGLKYGVHEKKEDSKKKRLIAAQFALFYVIRWSGERGKSKIHSLLISLQRVRRHSQQVVISWVGEKEDAGPHNTEPVAKLRQRITWIEWGRSGYHLEYQRT